nr:metal-dependent hydrolase [Candidatus Nardonella dryophthoridicola]
MIIPDIDHKGSYINKYNIFIKNIKNILNHRSFTHSFFFYY